MQFRKISDTKIRCEISQEEMWEKGIEIDDFLDHREKTEEFIRDVLAEAKYELDLDDMGCFYSVQMSVRPEGGVSLLITGEHPEPEQALQEFGKRLQDFKQIMEEAKKQIEAEKEKKEQKAEAKTNEDTKPENPLQTRAKEIMETPIWVRMTNLDNCRKLAKRLAVIEDIESALYKYDDEYYMQLSFCQDMHQVAGTILVVSEFSEEVFTHEQGGQLLIEHGLAVCKERAVQVLSAI